MEKTPHENLAARARRSRLKADRRSRVQLEPHDLEVFRILRTLKLATIDELELVLADVYTNRDALWRRLNQLFHSGYLTRPLAQTRRLYGKRGGPPQVYALGNKAAAALRSAGDPMPETDFNQRAKTLKLYSLEHTLLTSRVVASFLAGLSKTSSLHLRRILPDGEFRTTAVVPTGERVVIKPDALLVIEDSAETETLALFIEADRGTMPKSRYGLEPLEQSSFLRKALAYAAYWQDAHRFHAELEAGEFIVLTIAANAPRADALRETAHRAGQEAAGIFWFTHVAEITLEKPSRVLSDGIWTTAAGSRGSLF